jgi:hypothetical protein
MSYSTRVQQLRGSEAVEVPIGIVSAQGNLLHLISFIAPLSEAMYT